MRILYVEDSEQDADLTARRLRASGRGFQVDRVVDQKQAVQKLQRQAYDLLLADLSLPVGSGLELLREVRSSALPVAVVIVTGRGDEETTVAALRAGADDYIVKQGDYLERLPDALAAALARYRATEDRRSRTLHVLYAESNPDDVDLTRRHFGRYAPHIQIDNVSFGAEVLSRLTEPGATPDYHVLLLDYRLPGLSGLDLLKEIRQVRRMQIPVVLVTGRGDEGTAREALRLGADNYVVKSSNYIARLPAIIENAHNQRQIELERDQYRDLFNRVPVGLYRTTSDGTLLSANPAVVAMFGYQDIEQMREAPVSQFYADPQDRVKFVEQLSRDGEIRGFEAMMQRRDGTRFWASVDAALTSEPGAPQHLLEGVIEDITERRQAQEHLQHQSRLAAMGRLAGGIAHDFNNILAAIVLYAQMPLARPDLPTDLQQALTTILDQAGRAAKLVSQILDFSRHAMINTQPLSLIDLIKEAESLLQRTIPEKVTLVTDLESESCTINADPTRIHQVLMNLTLNAIDAMPDGGILTIAAKSIAIAPGEAPVSGMGPGRWAVLSVSDSGTGMTDEVRDHLYEPFYTTKAVGEGTGLGLAQVYGIVKQHGGFIDVETNLGRGTTFTVYLPLTDSAVTDPVPDQNVPAREGRGETVLVVEDMASLREVIESGLEALNYRALSAESGEQALTLWRREAIDLCLTDIGMPGISGQVLLQALRAEDPDAKIIAMTGHVLETDDGDLRQSGFDGVLHKPFSIEELGEIVWELLHR